MTNRTSPSKLPAETQAALQCIRDQAYGFDRLVIWIDHPAPDLPKQAIERYCGEVDIFDCGSVRYQTVWQTKIELYQPSNEALRILERAIKYRYRTKVSYAEIATDWITSDEDGARTLQLYLLKHLYLPYSRQGISFMEQTAYFSARSLDTGVRRAQSAVIYTDRKSKLFSEHTKGSPCCHIEYRFTNMTAASGVGLNTIADCVGFDHLRFWQQHLHLLEFSSKADLGSILYPDRADASQTALRNRADHFLLRHTHGGVYVLQDCIAENREIRQILRSIDNRHFLLPSSSKS